MADEDRFAKGDLNSVMAAYPHVAIGSEILNHVMVQGRCIMVHLTGMPRKTALST